jgi:hypothetical protein
LMIERHATREPHIASTSGSVGRPKNWRLVKDAMPADGTWAADQKTRSSALSAHCSSLGQNTLLLVIKEGQRDK